jgi:alpha-L-fucosidase
LQPEGYTAAPTYANSWGIFIHWGPYSVPAWTPKGVYEEWYQYWLQTKNLFGNFNPDTAAVYKHHTKKYGEHFSYYNFGEMFKCEDYHPEEWAKLFVDAGAKYIVLTSKHHDGFALWPSKEADKTWGFPWNAVSNGPRRDVLGDLAKEVRKTDVKFGLYYSLYEWYNPLWLSNKNKYINEHYLPQIKDLINTYQPDILWSDGDWELTAEEWKAPEFLAWLYNESPVKDKILVNDRWGKDVRRSHGSYLTSEYGSSGNITRPWEECRGIGFSFGYNRNEDAWDYNSEKTLILTLVDVVSHGGNLLLDIGPDGTGKIPPIMQERLLQIGK